MPVYGNLIGGKWVKSASGRTFESLDPATGRPIGTFQSSTEKDIKKAVSAARKAFPGWKAVPAPERGQMLFRIAELLRNDKERLASLETREMGKAINEARGDVQEAIDIAEYMAAEGRRLLGHTTPSELPDRFCATIKQPVGVFGLITPWNFPIAIPAWKLMPALIAGNTIVFKPSSDSPLCAIEFVKILEKAGIPPGVVNLVTGSGRDAGGPLVKHKDVGGISFTGSMETGIWITQNAGLKKVGLELGGKNPIIVMDDADLDLAVDGVLWGGYATTGQRCTACSRVIVHEKVLKAFERKLLARIGKLKVGNGMDPKTDVGPLVNKAAVDKTESYVKLGKAEGAKLCCGGKRTGRKGCFFQPTLFTNCSMDMKICQEEIFGPIVSLIPVKGFSQAIDAANSVDYGLSSAIYTSSMKRAFRAIELMDAGITYVNSSTIGAEVHLPFGGTKATGNGTREAGIEGLNEFTETKAVYIDYSGRLQKAQKIK
ncbi:MAG: aldehyde dehydrogenase family protein [Candidatus Aenigmarchaeota archaeon]